MVVPLDVYNHVKNFWDVDDGQIQLPDSTDEYKSDFSCPFFATKNGEMTAVLSEGVVPLGNHIEDLRDFDEDQAELPDTIDEFEDWQKIVGWVRS